MIALQTKYPAPEQRHNTPNKVGNRKGRKPPIRSQKQEEPISQRCQNLPGTWGASKGLAHNEGVELPYITLGQAPGGRDGNTRRLRPYNRIGKHLEGRGQHLQHLLGCPPSGTNRQV